MGSDCFSSWSLLIFLLCIMLETCMPDDFWVIFLSAPDKFINSQRSNSGFVMHTYRKCQFEFYFFIHLLVTLWLYFNAAPSFSIKLHILNTDAHSYMMSSKHSCQKHFPPEKGYIANCYFSLSVVLLSLSVLVVLWPALLLQQSGDVHPNPGPSSFSSDTSSASAASVLSSIDFAKHLSFVQYNVQSVFPKLDVLFAELCDLDIIAFSEIWLNSSITNDDLLLQLYHSPERKDWIGDSHGGVMIYFRDTIHYIRRRDLEPQGIECLWIELTLKHKHILFGLFYRPQIQMQHTFHQWKTLFTLQLTLVFKTF